MINGSHRQGNTEFMLQTMMNQIQKMGLKHSVKLVNLR